MQFSLKPVWIGLLAVVLLVVGLAAYQVRLHSGAHAHLRAAQEAIERRDFRQASDHLKQCLRAWPNDAPTHLLAAQVLRRQGKLDLAQKQLRVCEEKKVWQEAIDLEVELLRVQQGNLASADKLLASSLESPEAPESHLIFEAVLRGWARTIPPPYQHVNLVGTAGANVMALTGKTIDLWLRLRSTAPDQAQGLAWRGRRHALVGDYPAAVADFRKAINLDSDNFDARLWLAETISQQSPLEALEHFRLLHQREPENSSVRFGLATGLRGVGRLEESARVLDAMLAEEPNWAAVLLERAIVDLDLRQYNDAEPRLRRALSLAPNDPEVHLALNRFYQSVGRPDDAKLHYKRFTQLDSERKRR